MSILFLIERYPGFGGIETVTTFLSNHFVNCGFKVGVVRYQYENEELLDKLNPKVFLYTFPNTVNRFSPENKSYIKSVIEEFQPNYLINQENYSGLFGLLKTIDRTSFKMITVEHNSPDARYKMLINYLKNEKVEFNVRSYIKKMSHGLILLKQGIRERKYHKELYKLSDEYVLLSIKFKPILKKIGGFKSVEGVTIIENPITITSTNTSHVNKEKSIIYVGRLDYGQKRVDRLIRIWAKISPCFPDWNLMIIGDGPDRPRLEAITLELQVTNISFVGAQTDVDKYYSKAAIICLTSNVEGWPLVLNEAMAFGCVPIVYDSFAAASDIIQDKFNGRLIEPFNENKFNEALTETIENESQRSFMSQNAIYDSSRFSLETIGKKWNLLLRK